MNAVMPVFDCIRKVRMPGIRPRRRILPLAALLALAWLFVPDSTAARAIAADTAAPATDGVQEGREALGSHRRYPWYDEKDDGLRRVNVRVPWAPPKTTYNRPTRGRWNWSFSWLELGIWSLALLFFFLLAYVLIRAYLNREDVSATAAASGASRISVDDATRIEALPFRVRRGPLTLLEEARRHYELGDLRQAIIYLFSYELVEMDKQQIIRLAKGKTNRQYLREIRRRRPLQSLVEQTMVAFEDVFFGDHPLSPTRFESCWRRVDEFETLIAEPAT
jgi:hypothetical protein